MLAVYDEVGIRYKVRHSSEESYGHEEVPGGGPVATTVELPWVAKHLFDFEGNYLATEAGEETLDFYRRGEEVEKPLPEFDPTAFAKKVRELRSGPKPPSEEGIEDLTEQMSVGVGYWNKQS